MILFLSTTTYIYQNYKEESPLISKKTPLVIIEEEDEEDKKTMQIERAQADFQMLRDPRTNKIPRTAAIEAYQAAEQQIENATRSGNVTLPNINIEVRGPSNYGGRCRSLDFDARNSMIGVAGGVSGGIFRTTDGANNWTKVTPAGQIHNLTCIAQDKSSGNEDTWYAGSGEQEGNSADGDGAAYYGNGVWKSMDNGETWDLLESTTGTLEEFDSNWDYIHRILVDPTNRNVYAGNAGGVYRSTDQGANWQQVLVAGEEESSTITEVIRTNDGTFYAAISSEGIYKSTSGDLNSWTQIADAAALADELGRIVLNSAPNAPNLVYAFYTGESFNCGGQMSSVYLRRWDNLANGGTGAWTGNYDDDISTCANSELELDPQGGYNLCVAVRPNNANEIYIGGERLYRFTITGAASGTYAFAGGDQGNPTTTNIHVDHHLLLFTDNNTLWSTNDGGMRSTNVSNPPDPNDGFSWTSKTQGLVTYQFYRGDISPTIGSSLVGGGAQDNANNLIPTGTTDGTELGGGDGVQFALISGTNTSNYMAILSTQNGNTERYAPGVEDFISPDGSTQGFLTFFVLDGDNTNHLYYPSNSESSGTNKAELFRTRIVTTVSNTVTGDAGTGWEKMTLNNIADFEDITAMGLSRNVAYNNAAYTASDANRKLYFGTNGGKVYRVADPAFAASYNLTDITPNGAMGYISDIAVNPNDDKEIMVTLSNYNVSSIYHTTDATAGTVTWTMIEGATTDAVAKASVRSAMITSAGASTLYIVGTSTGLYGTTTLAGANTVWERIGTMEIAYALCVDMRLRTGDNKIGLATHGNGMFILSPIGDAGGCAITAITAGAQSACDPNTNTYTQNLDITYASAPATGMLVVNGQNFAIGTSPQTVTLTGLSADGQAVNAVASFSANVACTFTENGAFTAPMSCGTMPTCNSYMSTGTETIPEVGTVTSTINVPVSGTITDVNINNLQGTHGYLGDLTITLTSPQNTTVTLFSNLCDDNADGFNISLDDQAGMAITCPLNDGATEQPEGDLSDFNNEEANGDWVLTITDAEDPDGGQLTSWTLEVCGTFSGGGNCNMPPPVSGNIPPDTYQINGDMTSGGMVAAPNTVLFKASNSITLTSDFEVQAGATFEATIENCTPLVEEEEEWANAFDDNASITFDEQLAIYPNPFSSETTIVIDMEQAMAASLQVYDLNGMEVAQLMRSATLVEGKHSFVFQAENLPMGIYTVVLKTGEQITTKRLVLMK